MKNIEQFTKNVNYVEYMSICMIEICNTQPLNFACQRHLFSQFTFKLHLARNDFDCLLRV